MKRVNANVEFMAVFVIINNVGMKINAGMNAKNWLIKVYAIKGLSGIRVIVSVNVVNHVMLVDYENFKCRKKLVDKLVKECTETV